MSLTEAEFSVLRQTIATRGTVRIVIVPAAFFAWAVVTLVLMLFSELPVAALLSLSILAAAFEAVYALHVGVERIGRYLQVAYEDIVSGSPAPRWETTTMQAGPAFPGGGVDPLFSVLFLCAAVLNVIPALLPGPTPIELAVVAVLHAAFAIRVVRARLAANKQRAAELERYRTLLLRKGNGE